MTDDLTPYAGVDPADVPVVDDEEEVTDPIPDEAEFDTEETE